MNETAALFGKVAGAVSLLAFVPYIVSILRRQSRPNRATWWIWAVLGTLLGASYYASGATHTVWVPVSYFVGPLTVAVLSVRYGEGGWSRFDRWCLVGAGVSLVLWWAFSTPLVALVLLLTIDLAGGLPTIRKSYLDPESEDSLTWCLFLAGNTLNLFAVTTWSFALASYPVYMFLGSGVITVLVLRKHFIR